MGHPPVQARILRRWSSHTPSFASSALPFACPLVLCWHAIYERPAHGGIRGIGSRSLAYVSVFMLLRSAEIIETSCIAGPIIVIGVTLGMAASGVYGHTASDDHKARFPLLVRNQVINPTLLNRTGAQLYLPCISSNAGSGPSSTSSSQRMRAGGRRRTTYMHSLGSSSWPWACGRFTLGTIRSGLTTWDAAGFRTASTRFGLYGA
jgi:hypothetical protein